MTGDILLCRKEIKLQLEDNALSADKGPAFSLTVVLKGYSNASTNFEVAYYENHRH